MITKINTTGDKKYNQILLQLMNMVSNLVAHSMKCVFLQAIPYL